jgi:Nickel responsive protein SCO4226-like
VPKFVDHHEMRDVGPELAEGIAERIKAGQPDEHGVRGLNVFFGKDGTAFCLSEAPDAGAVVKAHEAVGLSLGPADVVEVERVV